MGMMGIDMFRGVVPEPGETHQQLAQPALPRPAPVRQVVSHRDADGNRLTQCGADADSLSPGQMAGNEYLVEHKDV